MTSEQSGSSERAAAEHAPGMVRVSVEVDEDAPLAPEEGSPPPPRARGADGAPLETKWQARQRAVFTRWINQRLARRGGPVVEDLYVDLRDGFALVALLDELGGEGGADAPRGASPAKRRLSSGGLRIQHIANVSVAFKQLEARAVRTTGIGPPDIVDGNVTLVLGLVYSIIAWSTTRAIDSAAPARGSDDSDEARGGGGEGAGGGGKGGGSKGGGGEGKGGGGVGGHPGFP